MLSWDIPERGCNVWHHCRHFMTMREVIQHLKDDNTKRPNDHQRRMMSLSHWNNQSKIVSPLFLGDSKSLLFKPSDIGLLVFENMPIYAWVLYFQRAFIFGNINFSEQKYLGSHFSPKPLWMLLSFHLMLKATMQTSEATRSPYHFFLKFNHTSRRSLVLLVLYQFFLEHSENFWSADLVLFFKRHFLTALKKN